MDFPVVVYAMAGLGDTIYQRPFFRALGEVHGDIYVRTPWPELVNDLQGVHPCFPPSAMELRTQGKNMERVGPDAFEQQPARAKTVKPRYHLRSTGKTALMELEEFMPLQGRPLIMDLPDFPEARQWSSRKPLAMIRPTTLRKEWRNDARNPLPYYVNRAAELLRDHGYHVVSVADIDGRQEWVEGVVPPIADEHYLRGELTIPDIVNLTRAADVVVGGVGFVVPMCMATGSRLVCIAGGQGAFNGPEKVLDERIDCSGIEFILPTPYCRCQDRFHPCNKVIADFESKFEAALVGQAEAVA